MCPTLCQLKTTCLLLIKQKLYALDAFFIEKLKLSENDLYLNTLFAIEFAAFELIFPLSELYATELYTNRNYYVGNTK